jgi:hypothetical protein
MAIGWYVTGFRIYGEFPRLKRECMMTSFDAQILADGGAWAEVEVLGGYALVKVRASATTLTTIANTTGYQRVPAAFTDLTQTLGSLTTAQRTAILNKVLSMGYTQAELEAVLGTSLANWRTKTLGQLLRFIAQRRKQERVDAAQQQIVLDGEDIPCSKTIAQVDDEVTA